MPNAFNIKYQNQRWRSSAILDSKNNYNFRTIEDIITKFYLFSNVSDVYRVLSYAVLIQKFIVSFSSHLGFLMSKINFIAESMRTTANAIVFDQHIGGV